MIGATSEAAAGDLLLACIAAACEALLAEEEALCALDRAIGDGDHGTNVARAAHALLAARDELAALSPAVAIERAGTIVAMRIGGASGPLYGSLLMAMGRAWREPPSLATIAAAFDDGVAAVARRGRAATGAKTMLDVLSPAAAALRSGTDDDVAGTMALMVAAADAGLEATRPLQATRGRAAFVGARAIGHVDPGAASARLCIHAVAQAVAGREESA